MNNKELLKRLNENSKKFMDDFFSFYAFFVNQTKEDNFLPRQIDEETMEEINHKMLEYQALFLSMLKNDDISSKFYNKYGITYDNFKEKLKDYDFDDLEFIKAENCDEIDDGYLRLLFVRISLTVEYTCYLEKEKINYDTLQPFQLFDSLFGDAEIAFEDGLKDLYNIDDDLFKNYKDYIHDYYSDFAQLYFGINIDEEREKELNNYTVYDYDTVRIEADNNSAYITFKENVDLEKLINHVNRDYKSDDNRDLKSSERKEDFIKTLKLPAKFAIEELKHNDKVDVSVIEKDLLNDDFQRIPIKLRNLENNKTCTIWIYKYEAFTSESDKIINTILNKHYDDNIRPYNVNNDIFPAPLQNTPNLDIYGLDLTRNQFVKDPSIGRDEEIKRIEQILCYPERDKSVIITGVAGCGKTALVQGLAYRIQNGNVPDALKNLRIISIDVSSLVSGCRYVGMLEERMRNILEEAAQSKDIVLFIDEIHQALGAGKSEGDPTSVAEILKPYLDYGKARIIGSTTTEEYNEFVSKDDAFKTRFKRINLNEPDNYIIYQILEDLIISYNKLSDDNIIKCPRMNFSDEEQALIINWLIESTGPRFRTYNDRASNPRLVLDIIKEAYAIATVNSKEEVDINDIKEALLLENRLYDSSKLNQISKLDEYQLTPTKNNIIQFSLIKKIK